MLDLDRILNQERLLRALTGLDRQRFDNLLLSFQEVYEQSRQRSTTERQRALGGGRKATLESPESKLLFILLYCKCYPTFDLLSILVGFDRACAHHWVHRLLPLLEETLGEKQCLPVRKLKSVEEFLTYFPEVKEVIVDGTERQIHRPEDKERQKQNYSGKKKCHTRKHITGSTKRKRVIFLSDAAEGRVHDKRLLEESGLVDAIPDEVEIQGDLGFQGLQKEHPNVRIPHKKPQGGELTQAQKEENRALNAERVVCEHAHGGIKRYQAVAGVYRNHVPNFDDCLMVAATGLWNFYLDAA